jgi:hypothetical protein
MFAPKLSSKLKALSQFSAPLLLTSHSELWRALPGWRADQHGLRGIDGKSGDQQALLQEAADGLDAARRPSAAADPDAGLEW